MGESPRRPGSFHARPEVVVAPEISPLGLTAETWMVPVEGQRICSTANWRSAAGMLRSAANCESLRARVRMVEAHSRVGWRGIAPDPGVAGRTEESGPW